MGRRILALSVLILSPALTTLAGKSIDFADAGVLHCAIVKRASDRVQFYCNRGIDLIENRITTLGTHTEFDYSLDTDSVVVKLDFISETQVDYTILANGNSKSGTLDQIFGTPVPPPVGPRIVGTLVNGICKVTGTGFHKSNVPFAATLISNETIANCELK